MIHGGRRGDSKYRSAAPIAQLGACESSRDRGLIGSGVASSFQIGVIFALEMV